MLSPPRLAIALLFSFSIAALVNPAASRSDDRRRDPTFAEALRILLPEAEEHRHQSWALDAEARRRIERAIGRRHAAETAAIVVGIKGEICVGYAVLVEEQGFNHPISFVAGLKPDGSVADFVVISFRDTRGRAIREPAFRRRLAGKRPGDPMRLNREVDGITGATTTARTAVNAVRRALAICEEYRSSAGTR
jgi:Na+-translocating ferredoxin:NAD+ oxidoreductase RnfG subunit